MDDSTRLLRLLTPEQSRTEVVRDATGPPDLTGQRDRQRLGPSRSCARYVPGAVPQARVKCA